MVKVCTLLFLLRDDEILLAMKKRGFGAGNWNGIGGKVDTSETIEEATIRECQEEIGVTPRNLHKVAVHDFVFPKGYDDIETHTYLTTEWTGKPVETDEMAPKWCKLANIPYTEMWEDDIVWLPLVLQGKKLETKFTFDDTNHMLSAHLTLREQLR